MSFITFRRHYLDKVLNDTKFYGKVLDVGGKKEHKRGEFRPPLTDVHTWEYLNIDESTNPDYCCSADDIPVENGLFDIVMLAEVLEHLEKPYAVLNECYRVLKKDGKMIVTIPFLFPIHADPYDFQRWTDIKIKLEFEKAGFNDIEVKPMGSLFAVIYDIIYTSLTFTSKKSQSFRNRFIRRFILRPLSSLFLYFDRIYMYKAKNITTGYYIEARK